MTKDVTRLLNQFIPERYDLHLDIDDDSLVFSGTVRITGKKLGKPSQRLTFHQKDLTVTHATVVKIDQKTAEKTDIKIQRINNQDSYDEVRLHSDTTIYPGKYEIELHFNGKITKPMDGIYPCFFKENNTEKRLIATQFESHHARQAFPCIDEPAAKAVFALTISCKADTAVVSNTPVVSQTQNSEKRQVTLFEDTPIMSTYLLAFVLGDIKYLEGQTKRGVRVRTYATPDKVEHTAFALEVAVKTLDYYEDYFGIEYPLEKCDMIALPDFASGAMENWGCITYREVCMLDDPKNTSLSNRQLVALVVAHELAHQWFGNLVTMRWWTDLWLNEGFASWIEYLAVDHLFPEWQLWEQFLVSERERGLKLDALHSTHPIEVPVHHPDEIRTIFDSISYSKGASVINMLHGFLGKDAFRNGLHNYLKKHQYSNTDTVDLWDALEEVSHKPVKEFMHSWTSMPGFPVLSVSENEKNVAITQERFFLKNQESTPEVKWPVPLLCAQYPEKDILDTHTIELPKTSTAPLFNSGQTGFYRVAYDSTTIKQILENHKELSNVDVIGLLSDLAETTKMGLSSSSTLLSLLPVFSRHERSTIWDVIAGWVANMRMVMDDDEIRELLKPYIMTLISEQYSRLGWDKKETDTVDDQLLRPTILSMGVSVDHPEITEKALSVFRSITDANDIDPELRDSVDDVDIRRSIEIDPDLRGVVFGATARNGSDAEYNKMLKMHNETSSSEERDSLCAGLTGFKQPELIKRSLELITSDNVKLQDVTYWIVYSLMNRHARLQTWEWLKQNWGWLEEHFEGDLGFYRVPIFVARSFSQANFVDEYNDFFDPLRKPATSRSIDQGLETLMWHIEWRDRELSTIKELLKNQ